MRHEAIYKTHPNVVSVDGKERAFDKDGNVVIIDETKVAEEITKLQAEHDANQYQRDREVQYPSIKEQLDMQYHDLVNGTTTWKDAIAKVKTENPKSE